MERDGTAIKNKNVNYNNKIKINKYINHKVVIFTVIGFLLSRFTLVDNVAPFGIAFFLFLAKINPYKIPVFLGTLLGTILSFNDITSIVKYSICLIIILLVSKKISKVESVAKISILDH